MLLFYNYLYIKMNEWTIEHFTQKVGCDGQCLSQVRESSPCTQGIVIQCILHKNILSSSYSWLLYTAEQNYCQSTFLTNDHPHQTVYFLSIQVVIASLEILLQKGQIFQELIFCFLESLRCKCCHFQFLEPSHSNLLQNSLYWMGHALC